MSKKSDRILVITDLLLGAAYADSRLDGAEQAAVRELLQELLGGGELPPEVDAHVKSFKASAFDLRASAQAFSVDPLIQKRKLLELVSKVHEADDEIDFAEDEFLVELARALGVPESDYKDLTLEVQIEELRTSLAQLRPPPLPTARPKPGEGVDVDVDVDD